MDSEKQPLSAFLNQLAQVATNNADCLKEDPIVSAWIATEVLTPQPLPNNHEQEAMNRVFVRLEQHPEPWKRAKFAKRNNETKVFWMVYLAEMNLKRCVDNLVSMFPYEAASEQSSARGMTALAVVVLDASGYLVPGKTYLSSFAWGYGKVLAGEISVPAVAMLDE